MVNFTINVVSDGEDKRVPVSLAGQIMIDVQDLYAHIGEYLISKDLRLQGAVGRSLCEKFRLYIDQFGSMSLSTSSDVPETSGYGNLLDDAATIMISVLDAMGNGTGSYWMEDNFKDALYRNMIIYDLVALDQDLAEYPGFSLMYGPSDNPKRFGNVDIEKLSAFIQNNGLRTKGMTIGLIVPKSSKSKGTIPALSLGNREIRINEFTNPDARKSVEAMMGKGPAVIVGTLVYSEEGDLTSVEDAEMASPADMMKFGRIVSDKGDIALKTPISMNISFANGKWSLTNEDLGIDISKETWDEAVVDFHNYAVFLWTEYASKDDIELGDEEKEIRDCLRSMVA